MASASEYSESGSGSDETIGGEETESEDDADFQAREDRDVNILRHLGVLFPGSSYDYGLPPPEHFDQTIFDEPVSASDSGSESESETASASESDSTIGSSSSNDSSDSDDSDDAQEIIAYCHKHLPFRTVAGVLDSDYSDSDSESDATPCPLPLPQRRGAPNASTLQSRLASLLPALKSANEALEREREAGTLAERDIENVKEEEGKYIEMELGLGVLEEKRAGEDGGPESEVDEENIKKEDQDKADTKQLSKIPMQRPRARSQKGVLDRLMGKPAVGAKPAIEVL